MKSEEQVKAYVNKLLADKKQQAIKMREATSDAQKELISNENYALNTQLVLLAWVLE